MRKTSKPRNNPVHQKREKKTGATNVVNADVRPETSKIRKAASHIDTDNAMLKSVASTDEGATFPPKSLAGNRSSGPNKPMDRANFGQETASEPQNTKGREMSAKAARSTEEGRETDIVAAGKLDAGQDNTSRQIGQHISQQSRVPNDDENQLALEELMVTQERLADLQVGLRELFDSIKLPLLLVNRQGAPFDYNKNAKSLLAVSGRLLDKGPRAFLSVLDRGGQAQLLRAIEAKLRGEDVRPFAVFVQTAQNTTVEYTATILNFRGYTTSPLALVALVDRQLHDATLNHNELLQALVDGSDDLIYAFDPQGHMLFANRSVARLLGRAPQDLVGSTRDVMMPLSDALAHRIADERVLETKLTVETRETFSAAAGSGLRFYDTRKFLLTGRAGEVIGVGGVSTDVTEDVTQMQALQMSELVFQQSSDAVIVTDVDLRIVRTNPSFELHTGFSQQSVLRRPAAMLLHDGTGNPVYSDIQTRLQTNGRWAGEVIFRRSNGEQFETVLRISALKSADGSLTGYVIFETDISAIRQAENTIQQMARYDVLTGLPNRALLYDRLRQAVRTASWGTREFAVLYIDLDNFKDVNDSLGHAVGDQLLQKIAERLPLELRSDDMVARVGGDEFVVLLSDANALSAPQVAQKLLAHVRRPLYLAGSLEYIPSLSIGVALFPAHATEAEALLQCADTAMYAAKDAGRGAVAVYNPEMKRRVDWQLRVRAELASALSNGQMKLYLQPKFALADRKIIGAEALIRWFRSPDEPPLFPGEFLWAIEQPPLLAMLDDWVLEEAARCVGSWNDRGMLTEGFVLSLNKTATTIESDRWLENITTLLTKYKVPPAAIEIEFTENILANFNAGVEKKLRRARNFGISFSIDDFGTGYSNLAYLQKLPISVVKIDISFVRGIVHNKATKVLVRTMISMARNLGLRTVAEGVETEEQRQILERLGCDFGQGYLVAHALPIAEFEAKFMPGEKV